ncbi:hypothetical protein GQ600_23958 [Phytophthora cactorum]|nr:hypothetical protein GQ600_23958 [Phytophthora cactorum]
MTTGSRWRQLRRGTGEGGTATDANSGQDTTPNEGKADPNDESDDKPPTQVAGPATRAAATSTTPARVPKIKLNGKVRRAGRPHLNCAAMKAKAALALIEYNNGMKLRALLRDNDGGLAHDEEIELDSDGDRAGVSEVYVVSIEKVGKADPNDESDDKPPTQVAGPATRAAATSTTPARVPKIKLNGKVRRAGRPHLNCAAMKAKAALALIEYNNGMKLRALLRDNDVCDLVSTLWMIMPGVREVGSFLTTFPIKQKGGERPIQWRVDGDYVPDRVQFRLPESVVDTALDKLKGGLAHDEEIELDSDGDRAGVSEVYVVSIEKVDSAWLNDDAMHGQNDDRDHDGDNSEGGTGEGGTATDANSGQDTTPNEGKADPNDESDDKPPTQVAGPATRAAATSTTPARVPKIKLNGKVRRAGRPHLNCAAMKAKAALALIEYNNGMKLRALLRDNDVCDLVSTLWMIMPGVREVGSFLTTFPIKQKGGERPIQWRVDGDYVPDRVQFRLPESVVDTALDKLKGGLAHDEEIELDSDGDRAGVSEVYVVSIEKVGKADPNDESDDKPPTQVAGPATRAAATSTTPARVPKIKLNGKVRRAGRPHLNCAAMKAKAALALIEYNNGMKLRALLRDNDVCDLVSTLWMIMPGVREVGSFLTTFPIKQKGGERPIQWRVDGDYVPDRVQFRLPESVVDTALDKLKGGLAHDEEIELDSDGDRAGVSEVYVVSIEKVDSAWLNDDAMHGQNDDRDHDGDNSEGGTGEGGTATDANSGQDTTPNEGKADPNDESDDKPPTQVAGPATRAAATSTTPARVPKIKLNGKVRRAGRPHLNCAAMKAKAALALIEYNNGMKLRALLRDNDVCDLVSTLWMIMPGVREVGSFLTTFPIKQKGGERPIQWRVDGDYVPDRVQFRLPESVVDTALDKLKGGLAHDEEIELDSDGDRAGVSEVYVVSIEKVDSAWLNDDAMHGQNDDRDHDGDNSEGGTGEGGTATDANSGQDTTPNEGKADPNDESDDKPPTQVAGPATRAAATSTTPARVPKIKLNGKVRRAGRPHLNCAAMKAKAALALIEYNNGMKLRALLRDNDVCDLVSTLWMIMPGVREVGSFLTTFPIKQKGGERPIQWRVDGDYVPDRVQFRLPESVVDTALDKLKGGLAHDEEIELDSDGDRAGVSEVYVVSIEKVDSAWLNDDAMHGQNDDRDHDGDNSEGGTGEGGTATDANSGQDTTPNEGKADPNDESDDKPPTQVAGPATRAAATSTTPARVPKIKLNGKVRRAGRPHLNCAAMKAKAALALIEYNNGMKLRALLRDNDVCDLVSTLWMIMPGVREVGSFLTTFPIKQKGGERPIQWRVDGDYVPDRVQFRLPESVVDTALDKLKGGLAHDEEIELDSDGDRAGRGKACS